MQDITNLSALALSAAIADRRLDCRSVMAAYLSRIEAINPRLNAIVSLRPAVEWSANLRWGDRLVRPRIALGLTQYLTDPSPVVGAGFGDAVGVAAAMRVTSKVSRAYGDVVLGLDIGEVGGLTVGANLFARVSERSYQVGGGLQLRLPF